MSTPSDFVQLLDDIEREAREEGLTALADLRAMRLRYWMIARLIQRRRERGLTQQQVAALAGIGQAEISKIERGRKSPTIETYCRLAIALDMTLEDLVPSPSVGA